jgi:hypothetical protein
MPNGSAKIIKYEDTSVGPQPTLIPSTMPVETTIEISAGDETMVFNERISQEEFDWDVWLSEFQLLFLNLSFFDMILSSWGWFL